MTSSMKSLEEFGRVRLSKSFFMRDFLYSEISQVENIPNIPVNTELAILAGRGLCVNVLEPIQERLGKVSIRSAYRSPDVNGLGNEKNYNCAKNETNYARHIWDVRDSAGGYGATACIVVNSFVDYYEQTQDWTALAWWIHDHIPDYREMMFYPHLAAFNINWYSDHLESKKVGSQIANPKTGKKGMLTKTGMDNFSGDHSSSYVEWLSSLKK